MTPEALTRAARQLALPSIGLGGQERIWAATVVLAGDDLAAEVCARALAAAGIGRLRLVRRTGTLPAPVLRALGGSNPDVQVETVAWPGRKPADAPAGASWLAALKGATCIVRVGFDDDPMLRAAVRLGIPVVVLRGADDAVDVVSFRRHGPCPHQNLDVPAQAAAPAGDGPAAVVAAHVAAAEALTVVAGATTGEGPARARHVRVRIDGGSTADPDASPTRATDIPWAPECFACGGQGSEMTFS